MHPDLIRILAEDRIHDLERTAANGRARRTLRDHPRAARNATRVEGRVEPTPAFVLHAVECGCATAM